MGKLQHMICRRIRAVGGEQVAHGGLVKALGGAPTKIASRSMKVATPVCRLFHLLPLLLLLQLVQLLRRMLLLLLLLWKLDLP